MITILRWNCRGNWVLATVAHGALFDYASRAGLHVDFGGWDVNVPRKVQGTGPSGV